MLKRMILFAETYIKCGVGARAAREAGYSEKTADRQAYALLRNPKVLAYIESKRIKKEVHAEVTYQNQVLLANIAMAEVGRSGQDSQQQRDPEKVGLHQSSIRIANEVLKPLAEEEGLKVQAPSVMVDASKKEINLQLNVVDDARRIYQAMSPEERMIFERACRLALSARDRASGGVGVPPPSA